MGILIKYNANNINPVHRTQITLILKNKMDAIFSPLCWKCNSEIGNYIHCLWFCVKLQRHCEWTVCYLWHLNKNGPYLPYTPGWSDHCHLLCYMGSPNQSSLPLYLCFCHCLFKLCMHALYWPLSGHVLLSCRRL